MAKLEDLVEEVLQNIEGFNGDLALEGSLVAAITPTTSAFKIAGGSFPDGSGFKAGVAEIGTELVSIQQFDKSDGQATGVLRGKGGTKAVAHPAGTGVRRAPKYPRFTIANKINDVIESLYPDLWAVKTIEFNGEGSQTQYNMPANTLNILSVQIKDDYTPGGSWYDSRFWNFDSTGGSNSSTNKAIHISDFNSGGKIQVVYTAEPSRLEFGQDFTVSGLPNWCKQLVVLGACYRLVSFAQTAQLVSSDISQTVNAETMPFGSSLKASQTYERQYQQELTRALARMKMTYVPKIHRRA